MHEEDKKLSQVKTANHLENTLNGKIPKPDFVHGESEPSKTKLTDVEKTGEGEYLSIRSISVLLPMQFCPFHTEVHFKI